MIRIYDYGNGPLDVLVRYGAREPTAAARRAVRGLLASVSRVARG